MSDGREVFADPSLEETVLVYLFNDLSRFQDHRNVIDPGIFESRRYRALWDAAVSYYDRYAGIIDVRGLETMLNESGVSVEKKADYILLFNSIKSKSADKSQCLLAIDQLKILQQKRKLFDLASYVASSLKTGVTDVNQLSQDVMNKVLGLSTSNEHVFREVSLEETWEERVAEYLDREKHPEKYKGIPFGIKVLDDLTSGIYPQELAILFGGPGTGKSRMQASLAYNMYRSGHRILYVTIEMPASQVARLFDARNYMISSSGLRRGKLSTVDKTKYTKKKVKTAEGSFIVIDAPAGCTPNALIPIIRRYKTLGKIDAVFVDYLNLMEPNTSLANQNEALKIGTIGKELKRLARLENVAVITATTAKSETMKFEDVMEADSSHMGWSFLLGYQADMIFFLKKMDPADLLSKRVDLAVVKYRDGYGSKLSLGVSWDQCFVGDMNEFLQLSGAVVPLEVPK